MPKLRKLPGAALAVGAFILTVLLGIGGAPASALWQQSAAATMTVTASTTWPGPAFDTGCSNVWFNRYIVLSYSLPSTPKTLTYAASRPDGTFSAPDTASAVKNGNEWVSVDNDIFAKSAGMNTVVIRMTATFTNGSVSTSDVSVVLESAGGSRWIYCA